MASLEERLAKCEAFINILLTRSLSGGSGASALADLTDVDITAAASGDLLRHNGSSWVDFPDSNYASATEGVTNGNSHDHSGGDGAQIDHGGLAGLTDADHTEASLNLSDVSTNNSSTTKHGFLPKLDNSSTNFLNGQGTWAVPAGGSGAWTEIGDTTLGSAASNITFSGISAGYAAFFVLVEGKHETASTGSSISIYLNGETATTNYGRQLFQVYGTTMAAASEDPTTIVFCDLTGRRNTFAYATIGNMNYDALNKFMICASYQEDRSASSDTSDPQTMYNAGVWRNASNEITSIALQVSTGNLAAGTRAILLGLST